MLTLIIIGVVFLGVIVGAVLHERPPRAERQEVKALRKENNTLRLLVNRLDGMAQQEYDVSNNLFAHTVRQEIVNNRKELV